MLSTEGWYCECGERPPEGGVDPKGHWRCAGDHWQHYHGYPMGHVPAYHPALRPEPKTPFWSAVEELADSTQDIPEERRELSGVREAARRDQPPAPGSERD